MVLQVHLGNVPELITLIQLFQRLEKDVLFPDVICQQYFDTSNVKHEKANSSVSLVKKDLLGAILLKQSVVEQEGQ